MARSLVACEGTGRRGDPIRYWFPPTEARWKQSPFYEVFEEQRRQLNLRFQSLTERKRIDRDSELLGEHLNRAIDSGN